MMDEISEERGKNSPGRNDWPDRCERVGAGDRPNTVNDDRTIGMRELKGPIDLLLHLITGTGYLYDIPLDANR